MIYFIADTHFGCENLVANTRTGFANIEEHDQTIIDGINARVDRKDRLVICGDFCRKDPQKYRARIKCREVWLILGNHDKPSWAKCFSRCSLGEMIKLSPEFKVWASHYPHAYWPSSHHGVGHVYGHCHSQREATLDKAFPGRRSIDVGVDNLKDITDEYKPVSGDWVAYWLQQFDAHDKCEFYDDLRAAREE